KPGFARQRHITCALFQRHGVGPLRLESAYTHRTPVDHVPRSQPGGRKPRLRRAVERTALSKSTAPTGWGVWTWPNLVTAVRLAGIPLFCYLLLATEYYWQAAIVLAVGGGTDWVDGQLARRLNQVSRSEERRVGKECRCGW